MKKQRFPKIQKMSEKEYKAMKKRVRELESKEDYKLE